MSIDGARAELERVLAERADQLAVLAAEDEHRDLMHQVVVFRVGDEAFGVCAERVREISPLPTVTGLPGLPAVLLGIVQLRGELMSVADAGTLLALSTDAPSPFGVVLETPQGPVILAVNAVIGFRSVFADELIEGFAKGDKPVLATTRDFVSIVDVDRLLSTPGLIVRVD